MTTAARELARMLSWVLLMTAANAQQASGVVLGFDGVPAAGAVVSAYARDGTKWAEVLTADDGRFEVHSGTEIAALRVQLEGVTTSAPAAMNTKIAFAGVAHFTLRGHVKTPDGRGAANVDLLLRNADGDTLVNLPTDANGDFVIRLDGPAREIVVDPMGWQVLVAGPFDRDHTVSVELKNTGQTWIELRGRVIDGNGPCTNELVRARFANAGVVRVRSSADGRYTVWANAPVSMLEAPAIFVQRRGPFNASTTALDLDEHEHGLVIVVGRVIDKAGLPVHRAVLFGLEREGPMPSGVSPDGMTDSDGRFRLLVPRTTQFVHARLQHGNVHGSAVIPADRRSVEVRLCN